MLSFPVTAESLIKFLYPTAQELCKHFLTVVSGILVFSVTFSEKIVDFHKANRTDRRLLFFAWSVFVLALIGAGTSLVFHVAAAGHAYAAPQSSNWIAPMQIGGRLLMAAGVAFVLGLITLVLLGARAVWREPLAEIVVEASVSQSNRAPLVVSDAPNSAGKP